MTTSPARDFTPAVPVLWAYDAIIATLTREQTWRRALLAQVAPTSSPTSAVARARSWLCWDARPDRRSASSA
jgi:hypothetical protein